MFLLTVSMERTSRSSNCSLILSSFYSDHRLTQQLNWLQISEGKKPWLWKVIRVQDIGQEVAVYLSGGVMYHCFFPKTELCTLRIFKTLFYYCFHDTEIDNVTWHFPDNFITTEIILLRLNLINTDSDKRFLKDHRIITFYLIYIKY